MERNIDCGGTRYYVVTDFLAVKTYDGLEQPQRKREDEEKITNGSNRTVQLHFAVRNIFRNEMLHAEIPTQCCIQRAKQTQKDTCYGKNVPKDL